MITAQRGPRLLTTAPLSCSEASGALAPDAPGPMVSLAGAAGLFHPGRAPHKVPKLEVGCVISRGGRLRLKLVASDVPNVGSVGPVSCTAAGGDGKKGVLRFVEKRADGLKEMVLSLQPRIFMVGQYDGPIKFVIGAVIIFFVFLAVKKSLSRNQRTGNQGSLNDLVRRGQLKPHDKRGIARPLLYNDPFNNPIVSVNKDNSTVEMFGKVYRIAPVTLTKEQQTTHQQRRSRAYKWKRPTVFLEEGDSIPTDVDPELVRWIPSNHPFASSSKDIDEGTAKRNLYQKEVFSYRVSSEQEVMPKRPGAAKGDLGCDELPATLKNGIQDLQENPRASPSGHGEHEQTRTGQISKPVGGNE